MNVRLNFTRQYLQSKIWKVQLQLDSDPLSNVSQGPCSYSSPMVELSDLNVFHANGVPQLMPFFLVFWFWKWLISNNSSISYHHCTFYLFVDEIKFNSNNLISFRPNKHWWLFPSLKLFEQNFSWSFIAGFFTLVPPHVQCLKNEIHNWKFDGLVRQHHFRLKNHTAIYRATFPYLKDNMWLWKILTILADYHEQVCLDGFGWFYKQSCVTFFG